jgi:hypothetical protein
MQRELAGPIHVLAALLFFGMPLLMYSRQLSWWPLPAIYLAITAAAVVYACVVVRPRRVAAAGARADRCPPVTRRPRRSLGHAIQAAEDFDELPSGLSLRVEDSRVANRSRRSGPDDRQHSLPQPAAAR